MKKLLTFLIIISLFSAGWASAEDLSNEDNFQEKLKHYLKKAQDKIIPVLEKPLNKVNDWFKSKLKDVKSNFYKELEEMKISLLDLLKWGWQESKEGVESKLE